MTFTHRALKHLPVLAALLAVVTVGQNAYAQDLLNEDVEEAVVAPQQQFMIGEENFNAWVFGNARDPNTAKSKLETQFKLQVDEIGRVAKLSDGQKKKLELAARGDMKRFFDLVEDKRRSFQLVKNDQNKFNEFYQELRPLQTKINAGLFDDDSFYAKTVKRTLDPDQNLSYDQVVRERQLYRYRTQVNLVITNLDNAVGFRAEQRRQITKIILEQTRPPKKSGQYDNYVILYQLSKLPEARLKPFFKEPQWLTFKRQLDNAQRLEQFLKTQGILPDEFPDGPKAFAADSKAKIN